MSNEGKEPLVPKLRFPEFVESWAQIPLGSLGRFFRGLTYGADDVASEGFLVLRSSNIQGGQLILNSDLVFVTKQCPPELRLRRGDIAICMSNGSKALVGKSGALDRDYPGALTVGAFCSIFRPITPFAKLAFSTPRYEAFVATGIAGGNINNLKNSDLEAFEVHIPPSPVEQRKIADCLSSLDGLIAVQARKVDVLKTHKQGLMQQLFPREGESQPRLRFPDSRNNGAWKEVFLKEVFSVFQGFAFSSSDSVEEGVRWLKIADVGIQQMNHNAPSFLPASFQNQFCRFALREGDYVMALTRPILNGQLKMAQVDQIFAGALLNQRVGKLITSHHAVFIYFLLQRDQTVIDIEKCISGAEPPNLSAQQTENIKTRIPSPLEQQRIADCLTSLDTLITAAAQELETLKTHKKGLMQQLFPSAEESVA